MNITHVRLDGKPDGRITGIATQDGTMVPVFHFPHTVAQSFYAGAIPYQDPPVLTGPWDLTFEYKDMTSGTVIATAKTPTITGAKALPFVNTVTISGSGAEPTFNWTVPSSIVPDSFKVMIRDYANFISTGVANIIHSSGDLAGTTTSFTIPASSLNGSTAYSIEIDMLDTRDNTANSNLANVLSESRSYFDFSLLGVNDPPNVVLPTLISGDKPYYKFNANVVAGQSVFIDPLVAIGYDYQIGATDPNFTSVLLPTGVGDDFFDLWLWDGAKFVDSGLDIKGGDKFNFGDSGVDRFRILGIETAAGLDPNNVTAFITGLEFASSGQFTGTMTPLTANVPEPTTMLLFGTGIAGLAAVGRRKRS